MSGLFREVMAFVFVFGPIAIFAFATLSFATLYDRRRGDDAIFRVRVGNSVSYIMRYRGHPEARYHPRFARWKWGEMEEAIAYRYQRLYGYDLIDLILPADTTKERFHDALKKAISDFDRGVDGDRSIGRPGLEW